MKILIFSLTAFLLVQTHIGSWAQSKAPAEEQKQGLQLMREEEKLAHDVYTMLFENWQLRPFSNISGSESRHFEAIGYLLETFDIDDPAFDEPGKFRNPELSELYDSLVDRGMESLTAALEVGAFIEEVDIQDLMELIDASPNHTITTVYTNLLRGSENHLRAFTRNLSWREIEYAPKVLDSEVYAEIVGLPNQPGNRMNCGNSGKMQQGKGNKGKQQGNRGNGNCGGGPCKQK